MDEKVSSTKRVLIVDDEPHIGKVFGMKLQLAGYDVLFTTSGAEAIQMVRSEKPDVVLLDIVMPDVSGFDVLDQVRTFSQVPIIVFTARPEIIRQAIRFGANDAIGKPLDPEKLVEKIKALVGDGSKKPG